jgi:hypothetical protein
MRLPEFITDYTMPIILAESVEPLDMAEAAHITKSNDPRVIAQIEALLDDPITIERIAVNHSSLLVRMLAQRLIIGEEKIIGVAIKHGGVTYSLPRPKRHSDVVAHVIAAVGEEPPQDSRGFITNTGRYLNRVDAKKLALRNGQLANDTPSHGLFSQDLW